MIKAEDIQKAISGRLLKGDKNTVFSGISTDSRRINKGNIFWSLKGKRFDGHNFILNAIDAGAKGVVVEESYKEKILEQVRNLQDIVVLSTNDTLKALGDMAKWWRNKHKVKVIAVTGSAGKTSTKEMIFSILSINNNVLKNPGNYNNLIGLPLTLFNLNATHDITVLEIGMNMPGEIRRLTEIANPDIGIITNAGPAHLQGVKDIYGVIKAKTELIEKISSDGVVFINGDNELLVKIASQLKKKIIKFGKNLQNDIKLEKIFFDGISGSTFRFLWKGKSWEFKVNIPGISNVMNAMVASSVCLYLGQSEEVIRKGLLSYQGIKGRFEIIRLENDMILIDDTYNSNPLSLMASLETLKSIKGKRKVIVGLGDMLELGDYSVDAHKEAGKKVAELKPEFFIVMGSFSEYMIEGAKKAGMLEKNLFIAESHKEMAYKIGKVADRGCIIFLKASRAMAFEKVSEIIMDQFKRTDVV